GGKLRTTHIDGFSLDHGFQVIQSAYPALDDYKRGGLLDGALAFGSGAWLLTATGKTLIADPLKHGIKGIGALLHPDIKLTDVFKIIALRKKLLFQNPSDFFQSPTWANIAIPSTQDYLLSLGFSETIIESFFRPFFTGIFLEEALQTPCSLFDFIFWALAKGDALILPNGVQTLPNRIASKLNPSQIFLNSTVGNNHQAGIPYRSTTTLYYSLDHDAGLGKFLALNASRMGRVNLIAVPSMVQSSYAPTGKHLLSVSLKPSFSGNVDANAASNEILTEVENLLQRPINAQFLQSFEVKSALPMNTPYAYDLPISTTVANIEQNHFLAGQSIANPSLNAAILSGLQFAENYHAHSSKL
ncbi:MAG: hypothetical protein RL041_682, partial [Bacteroidota bacterium]